MLVRPEELGPDAPLQRILLLADNGDSATAASSTAEGVGMVGGTAEVHVPPSLAIAFENRQRLVEAFSEPGKLNDTGRTEVQGACCSAFIFVFLASPSTCFSKGGGFPSTVCPA